MLSLCYSRLGRVIQTQTIRFHCFLVFLSIQFYFMNMNSSAGKWKINQFIDEELIAAFQCFGLLFSNIKHKKKGSVILSKAISKHHKKKKKNVACFSWSELNSCARVLTTTCCLNFSEVRIKWTHCSHCVHMYTVKAQRSVHSTEVCNILHESTLCRKCCEDKDMCVCVCVCACVYVCVCMCIKPGL